MQCLGTLVLLQDVDTCAIFLCSSAMRARNLCLNALVNHILVPLRLEQAPNQDNFLHVLAVRLHAHYCLCLPTFIKGFLANTYQELHYFA